MHTHQPLRSLLASTLDILAPLEGAVTKDRCKKVRAFQIGMEEAERPVSSLLCPS